jgi:hypothetical protein
MRDRLVMSVGNPLVVMGRSLCQVHCIACIVGVPLFVCLVLHTRPKHPVESQLMLRFLGTVSQSEITVCLA